MVKTTKEQDVFLSYINDYIVFLEEMIEIQKRQLDAITRASMKDTEKIKEADKTVVELQGYTKRMEIMEQKRIEIQEQVGFGGLTFGEIIEKVDSAKKQNYSILLEQFKKTVDNIVFYRNKINDKIQSDLNLYNSVLSQPSSYNSSKQQTEVNRFGGKLKIKA